MSKPRTSMFPFPALFFLLPMWIAIISGNARRQREAKKREEAQRIERLKEEERKKKEAEAVKPAPVEVETPAVEQPK